MPPSLTAVTAALWLGVLTSLSPCPLATNIAAVAFIGGRTGPARRVLTAGVAYSLGRMLAYVSIGMAVVGGMLAIPAVSMWLQRFMPVIIGPVLILTGMALLELIAVPLPGCNPHGAVRRLAGTGIVGAGLLGFLFALAFCPVSAALFFGSLIPLAIHRESILLLPALYGFGTALPVLIIAVPVAAGTVSAGQLFGRITVFERWARRITGIVFIGIGLFFSVQSVVRLW